ncbi:transcriptional regulator [Photobacterium kishitanii]|uniref:DNA-binding protein n=1 Tax=Photobacterium kishitanii TaxID=318456 RepID=A0AAX0YNV3_9GAMM|nr:H-NS family nucleoid-associated regulatory protein [Photobacterium kishitanii]KJG57196.1 transcriptional regulator [Photobacterium kishitanii]KJG60516.1 transcriptional regulator [Photobacterium kishitanii]KJG64814.1 transcriptional regulator [Photobacterium kishitanii]PSX17390.1 transcriptional regulator [Photobacterium kishitanii]PSX25781.1 transcriptional regulator [Photobacterium kishitanii]
MTDAIKLLMDIRKLRCFTRESITLEQLQEALDKLTQVVNERITEEEQEKAATKERDEKLEIYRQMLLSDGLTPEDLLSMPNKTQKYLRIKRPGKYKYIDNNGDEKTWTGQGRTPKALKTYIDNGANLDDFLI